MKKILSAALVLLVLASLCLSAFAQGEYLIDQADILTDFEERSLVDTLGAVSEKHQIQVAVVTVDSLDTDPGDFAWDVYDELDYGYGAGGDGVLLLVCMNPREFHIVSNGAGDDAIGSSRIETICDEIWQDMTDGNYLDAFETYAETCDYYIEGEKNGFPFDFGKTLLVCLVIGLVAGVIVAFVLKGQLKSVRRQNQADAYVRPGSMQLTQCGDFFMYRTVTRTERQQNNSSGSGRSSGGRSF